MKQTCVASLVQMQYLFTQSKLDESLPAGYRSLLGALSGCIHSRWSEVLDDASLTRDDFVIHPQDVQASNRPKTVYIIFDIKTQ